jgi:hypothetical protein
MLFGIPVAALAMAGYLLMGVLAWRRAYRVLLVFVLAVSPTSKRTSSACGACTA